MKLRRGWWLAGASLAVCSCAVRVLAGSVWTSGGPYGGYVNSLAISPSAPAVRYVGTMGGGIFRSTDGGSYWTVASSGLSTPWVFDALAVSPGAPEIVIAGGYRDVGSPEGGLFRSTNAGRSWAATGPVGNEVFCLAWLGADTVYAGTMGGVFKSTDAGSTWAASSSGLGALPVVALVGNPAAPATLYAGVGWGANDVVFRSTDGGSSWTAVGGLTSPRSLALDPTDSRKIYVVSRIGGSGVWRSTDSGATWVVGSGLPPSLSLGAVVVDPSAPATVYAGASFPGPAQVFKSTDGGATWNATGSAPRGEAVQLLAWDPAVPGTLLAGTLVGGGLSASTDGGTTWTPRDRGLANVLMTSVVPHPADSATVYAASDDGGVWRSTDRGASWEKLDPTGPLADRAVTALALDPSTPGTLYAGANAGSAGDMIWRSTDGGTGWTLASAGLPANSTPLDLLVNPGAPGTVYAGIDAGLFRSTDAGATWAQAGPGGTANSLALHPAQPARPFLGSSVGLYRSTDWGATWAPVGPAVTYPGVMAVAVDPSNDGTVYAGLTGAVLRSTDGGDTWTSGSAGLPPERVSALAVDPLAPATVYAGTGQYGLGDGVYRSTDAGAHWTAFSAGLGGRSVQRLAAPPGPSGSVFAALYGGSVFQLTPGAVKGDLDADGRADLVLRSSVDGAHNVAWLMNGTVRRQESALQPDAPGPDWLVRGTDDFDADRYSDLVLWNQSTGAVSFWFMNGTTRAGAAAPIDAAVTPPPNWDLAATADLDGDGWPDLLWRNTTSQRIVAWRMEGVRRLGGIVPSPDHATDANWSLVGARDFDADGRADLLWYNVDSGKIVFWFMDASLQRITGRFATPASAGDANWRVVATADYGPGPGGVADAPDLVWRNSTSGRLVVWHMDHAGARTSGSFTTPDAPAPALDWTVVGPR